MKINPVNPEHLSEETLLSLLDDEISPAERLAAEAHLAQCDICRGQLALLESFSLQIDSAVQSRAIPAMHEVRQNLRNHMQSTSAQSLAQHPSNVMRRFGWGMGIAATLAFGVLIAPRHDLTSFAEISSASKVPAVLQSTSIEINGETFLPVPSSNADLDTSVPHIVQMQVPVSSLADIGIVFEPVTNRVSLGSETERSVLADVLVGADGQPRGVHVLGLE